MDTNELIRALAADTRRPAAPLSSVWWCAAGSAIAIAAAVFFAALGPRPDIAAAAETPRFLFKFVVTVTLAASAFGACACAVAAGRGLAQGDARISPPRPRSLAMAVVVELFASAAGYMVGQVDRHQQHCLPDLHSADRHRPARHFPAGLCATARRRDQPLQARSRDCLLAASPPPSTPPNARTIPRFSSPLGTRSRSPGSPSLEPPAPVGLPAGSIPRLDHTERARQLRGRLRSSHCLGER